MTNTATTLVKGNIPTNKNLLEDPRALKLEAANENELTARAKRGLKAWRRYRKVYAEVHDRGCMNWSSHRRDLRAACRFAQEEYFRKADIVARNDDGLLHYDPQGLKRFEKLGDRILKETAKELEQAS